MSTTVLKAEKSLLSSQSLGNEIIHSFRRYLEKEGYFHNTPYR